MSDRPGRREQRGGAWAGGRGREAGGRSGQIIAVFALAMALFLFVLFCAVVDLDFLFTWSGRVQAAAQVAAQSGANTVDPAYLYRPSASTTVIDTARFQIACVHNGNVSAGIGDPPPPRPSWASHDDGTRCASNGCVVAATVIKNVTFPITVLGFGAQVKASSQAGAVVGANVPAAASRQPACSQTIVPP